MGRVIDLLDELDVLDDTLIYYIIGDNGASAEGTPERHLQRAVFTQRSGGVRDRRVHGGKHRQVRHSRGLQPLRRGMGARHVHPLPVDQASGVPLRGNSQRRHRPLAQRVQRQRAKCATSSTTSSTSPPPCSMWPICPSRLWSTASSSKPLHGVSMTYLFDDADAADRRETQYFEMVCNRGIYHKGWMAVTRHSIPWLFGAELACSRRRRLGALRHLDGLDAGP